MPTLGPEPVSFVARAISGGWSLAAPPPVAPELIGPNEAAFSLLNMMVLSVCVGFRFHLCAQPHYSAHLHALPRAKETVAHV